MIFWLNGDAFRNQFISSKALISIVGQTLLLCSLISSGLAIVFASFNKGLCAKYLLNIQAFSAISAFGVLVTGFYLSDFSIQNVFLHSSNITPLLFKISAAWASHEGSMLLWFAMLSVVSYTCFPRASVSEIQGSREIPETLGSSPRDTMSSYIILGSILCAFSAFIYFTSNPFTAIAIKPHQGMGLNPILQDLGLAIHPPILYMGYVTYLAPFLYSCMALMNPARELEYMKKCVTYSKFGWMMLLTGVSLGSWWAYRELGWGGFWFFDPVENISLMPLIAATAFHHSLIFTVHNGQLIRWTIFFGLSIFLLTLLGTFLVRSGLLTSVHTFADDSGRGIYLAMIFGIAAVFAYGLFINSVIASEAKQFSKTPKMTGVLFGNIIWLGGLVIILFSLIYPLILAKFGYDISVSPEFFLETFIPVMMPIALLAGTFAYFKASGTLMRDYYISAGLALLLTYIVFFGFDPRLLGVLSSPSEALGSNPRKTVIITIAIFSGFFLMLSTIFKFLEKTDYFRKNLSSKMAAMLLSHFGYGLMVLSISLNSAWQSEVDFIGKRGDVLSLRSANQDPRVLGDLRVKHEGKITLQNILYGQGPNYYRQIAEFWIEDPDGHTLILRPENRLYKVEQAITAESDIYSSLWTDVYAVLSKIDDDVVHAKIYSRPFIGLLWIACAMMAGGVLITLVVRKK